MTTSYGYNKYNLVGQTTVQMAERGRTPNLIMCNRGPKCPCGVAKKCFLKTDSNDSGGSFDYHDNPDGTEATTLLVKVERNDEARSADCQEVDAGVKEGDLCARETEVNMGLSRTCPDYHDNYKCNITSGNWSGSSNIAQIFSKLAKDSVAKRSPQIRGSSPGCASKCSFTVQGAMTRWDDTMSPGPQKCLNRRRELCCSHLVTSVQDTAGQEDFIDVDLNKTMMDETGVVTCMNRSLSDPLIGAQLPEGEGAHLDHSGRCGCVRKSLLSLDLGISVSSFESLGGNNSPASDDCSDEDITRLQTVSPESLNNDNSKSHSDNKLDRLCGVVKASLPIRFIEPLSPEMVSPKQETSRSDMPKSLHFIEPFEDIGSTAGADANKTPPYIRIRRKRDFHYWINGLVNILDDKQGLTNVDSGDGLDDRSPRDEHVVGPNGQVCPRNNENTGDQSEKETNLVLDRSSLACSAIPSTPIDVNSTSAQNFHSQTIEATGPSMAASDVALSDTSEKTAASDYNASECVTNGCNKHKTVAHTNCLKTVGTAFRRISSPTMNWPGVFGSNKKYDLELASLTYFSATRPSKAKSERQKKLMEKFASTKSSSLPSPSSCVSLVEESTSRAAAAGPQMKDSQSSPMLVASQASPSMTSTRFRSFSVGSRNEGASRCRNASLAVGVTGTMSCRQPSSSVTQNGEDHLLEDVFDAQKCEKNKVPFNYGGSIARAPKKAQQFGLSLHDIKQNTGRIIPLPVEETVEFLKAAGADEVEGLFRRCARVSTMREVQEKYDDGENVDFQAYSDPHLAAAILKKFLRELHEPLMTYDLFEPITRLHFLEVNKQLPEVQRILQDELPEDNYIILKYVFQFLQQVVSKSDVNHMTAENIATVFGPNIAWPKGQANLAAVEQAVKFALILVENFDDVFLR